MVLITDWAHETHFAAESISASQARDFVGTHLVAHGLPHLLDDIRLVVSELATNAVVHAQSAFIVVLSRTDESVLLIVTDDSNAFPVQATSDLMDMSGRGLMLVEMLSHQWGTSIDRHGLKSVWASFLMPIRREVETRS